MSYPDRDRDIEVSTDPHWIRRQLRTEAEREAVTWLRAHDNAALGADARRHARVLLEMLEDRP